MNDPIDAFELQLRRLKPVDPSPALGDRIASALADRAVAADPRPSAWRGFLDRWIGPAPSLAWKFAAVAVALAILGAAAFVSRMELTPAAPMGSASPVIRMNELSPGATAAANPADNPAPANYRLARAESESRALLDEGLVRDESGALARRIRMQFIDTVEWRDATTGAQVVVSVPREELFSAQVRAF